MACDDNFVDLDELTQSFSLLKNAYFVENENRKQLEGLVHNYKEEVRISREIEGSERLRATSCQQYVAHEQEIVRQLIAVRGENAKLSESIAKLEENKVTLKQELVELQHRHEQEIMKMQVENKLELDCVNTKHDVELKEKHENWEKKEAEWRKNRAELLANIEALQKKVDISTETSNIAASLFEEKINNLQTENLNLQKELKDMQENAVLVRERANANINMWKKRSQEQERLQKRQHPVPMYQQSLPVLPPPPPPPPLVNQKPVSILKRGKCVSFNRNAILSSPNDFPDNPEASLEYNNRVCTPAPHWAVLQPSADVCAPAFSDTVTKQTPKKRRLFSENNTMNDALYEC